MLFQKEWMWCFGSLTICLIAKWKLRWLNSPNGVLKDWRLILSIVLIKRHLISTGRLRKRRLNIRWYLIFMEHIVLTDWEGPIPMFWQERLWWNLSKTAGLIKIIRIIVVCFLSSVMWPDLWIISPGHWTMLPKGLSVLTMILQWGRAQGRILWQWLSLLKVPCRCCRTLNLIIIKKPSVQSFWLVFLLSGMK